MFLCWILSKLVFKNSVEFTGNREKKPTGQELVYCYQCLQWSGSVNKMSYWVWKSHINVSVLQQNKWYDQNFWKLSFFEFSPCLALKYVSKSCINKVIVYTKAGWKGISWWYHINFNKVPGHINVVCMACISLVEGFFLIFRWQFELSGLLIILKAAGSSSAM